MIFQYGLEPGLIQQICSKMEGGNEEVYICEILSFKKKHFCNGYRIYVDIMTGE